MTGFSGYERKEEPYFSQNYFDPRPATDFPKVTNYLLVDNRDRDRGQDDKGDFTSNTAPYSFTINLDETGRGRYEQVLSARLKTLVFPKILNETYVVIDIAEFSDALDSTDNGSHRCFSVAFFDGVDNQLDPPMQPGDRKPIKSSDCHPQVKVFNPPLSTLSRLRVNFRKHGGQLVTKADVANVEGVSMLLEVTTLNRNLG
jgi:hypothetical protein